MGVSKLVLIIATGSVGTALYRNGRLSELQKLLSGEEGEDLKTQLQRITDVKRASQSRPIIMDSGRDISSRVLPVAAAIGALVYGYMWWKGISLSDLMFATKRDMATAVGNLTKHVENVPEKLDAAKEHFDNLDGKLDDRVEMSELIRRELNSTRPSFGD